MVRHEGRRRGRPPERPTLAAVGLVEDSVLEILVSGRQRIDATRRDAHRVVQAPVRLHTFIVHREGVRLLPPYVALPWGRECRGLCPSSYIG